MISHEYKFIFVHIDKTGGTSCINAIFPYIKVGQSGHDFYNKHIDITYYINTFENHQEYFKFTFVRNPFDRALSKYFHHYHRPTGGGTKIEKKAREMQFKTWVKKGGLKVFKPQYNFMYKESKLLVDFVGRFENLQEDFNIVCDKIGIPRQQLPHKNQSKHKHYTEYYDDETKEIVAEKYAKDIEYFGYEFGE